MRRDAGGERGRKRLHWIAVDLGHPADRSHGGIYHQNAQNPNARTNAAVLESKLDGKQGVARSLQADESTYLRCERIAHSRLGENTSAQPFGGERAGVSHQDAVHLRGALDLTTKRPRPAKSARDHRGFDLIVQSGQKRGSIRYLLLPAEGVGAGEELNGKNQDLLPGHALEWTHLDRRSVGLGRFGSARKGKRGDSGEKNGSQRVWLDCGES